jgi:hypothetical protein
LQNSNHACLTKKAKAYNLACLTKEAKALDIKGINSENTIIAHILKGSNPVKGSKSCTICINFTSCINLITLRKKDKIKAKKANRAKSKD